MLATEPDASAEVAAGTYVGKKIEEIVGDIDRSLEEIKRSGVKTIAAAQKQNTVGQTSTTKMTKADLQKALNLHNSSKNAKIKESAATNKIKVNADGSETVADPSTSTSSAPSAAASAPAFGGFTDEELAGLDMTRSTTQFLDAVQEVIFPPEEEERMR